MSSTISFQQINPYSLQIDATLVSAASLVEDAISRVPGAKITKNEAFRIVGEYESSDPAVKLPFAITFKNTSPDSTRITLAFRKRDPSSLRTHARTMIAKAIHPDYDPELSSGQQRDDSGDDISESHQPSSHERDTTSFTSAPESKAEVEEITEPKSDPTTRLSMHSYTGYSTDYKTTSGLGLFFAFLGWIVVAVSLFAGIVAMKKVGLVGLGAAIVSALFGLLIVAAGQLMRAQAEVANNSRLILMSLEKLIQARK